MDCVKSNMVGIAFGCKCSDPDSKQSGVKWAEHKDADSDGVHSASLPIFTIQQRRFSSSSGNLEKNMIKCTVSLEAYRKNDQINAYL